MQIDFSSKAKADLNFWIKSGNKSILKKISELLRAIQENPFEGIGKPEPLKTRSIWCLVKKNKSRTSYDL